VVAVAGPDAVSGGGSSPTASVIVVTYNHASLIARCLEEVQATVPPETEILVADNASADGTVDAVERAFPRVRVVRTGANLGYGGANNRAAAAARAPVLVFLNPDTLPQPGWLEALLAEVRSDPERVLATPKLLLAEQPDRIDTVGNDVHVSGITPSRGWHEPADRYGGTEDVSAVSGACFAISRPLFRRLGGFEERLFLYFEDTELSLRARLAGCRCVAVGHSRVLHDHRPGFPPQKLRYLERNRWWTLLILFKPRTLLALAPVLLLAEALSWAMAAMNGPAHLRAKALAWSDLTRWLPALPAARRRTQSLRAVPDAELLRRHATRLRVAQVTGSPLVAQGERAATLLFAAGRRLALALAA
jgi:GT2 family glycosyltransferase